MIVLYRTGSLRYVRNAERDLVKHFWGWKRNDNKVGGGGGGVGTRPYYLYIVRR